jgi:hypothetical protein
LTTPWQHSPDQSAVPYLTERIAQEEMHVRFAAALGSLVLARSREDQKPFELDLAPPLPRGVRIYMYNATRPPGGRPVGEHKIQLIVSGQQRCDRASFDHSGGRFVLLVGYCVEEDVFVLWDAGLYENFAWSRNVQVKAETILQASAGKLGQQPRHLRVAPGRVALETVIAVRPRRLQEAIIKRMEITRARLLRD